MSVQEYLDKHMLSRKIEDAVNAAVRAKTPDPVLFIVNLSHFLFSLSLQPNRQADYWILIYLLFWLIVVWVIAVKSHEKSGSVSDNENKREADPG